MNDHRTHRIPLRLSEEEAAVIRARAAVLGVKITPFIRDAALNPAIETSAERRAAVTTLFALRRELAGLVLLSREEWPVEEAAEFRDRARGITTRIDSAIDVLAEKGVTA